MEVDQERLEAESRADQDVLRALQKLGDVSTIVRPIDVRFLVKPEAAKKLECEVEKLGWFVLQTVVSSDGMLAIDAQVDGTTEPKAIRELTAMALDIEARTGARYDGWGTVPKVN